jgi:hypothetical protein
MPFIPKFALFMRSTGETNKEWQFAEQRIVNNISMVVDQQMLENGQTVNGKGTVAVHGVSSSMSCDQQQMLLPNVSY